MNEIPLRQLRKLKKTVFDDYQEWDIKPGPSSFEPIAAPTGRMGQIGIDITTLIDAEIARRDDAEIARRDDAATLIRRLLQWQLKAAIAGQETLQMALAEAQRRERAAVEDISHICRLCVGCDNRESIEPVHRGCPIWQWRGPLEREG